MPLDLLLGVRAAARPPDPGVPMEVAGKVVVITGAASGIGLAMASRFVGDGARSVVMADVSDRLQEIALAVGGVPMYLDATSEKQTQHLVAAVTRDIGPIDLYCANAGLLVKGGVDVPDAQWQRAWDLNLMAHVYAARALLPGWQERGCGYLLHTASAAGLLTGIPALPYAVSKHAVVALAEWLAIQYHDRGIRFSCLCPQAVRTPMMTEGGEEAERELGASAVTPEAVAETVVRGLAAESFLILPHPEVAEYERRRTADHDSWIRAMARLRLRLEEGSRR
jgi:NAD(P)-dependent dehydrogenase (short-subunit alcohol dehydrogenase family)